jgi:serine/threonine-protein kinase
MNRQNPHEDINLSPELAARIEACCDRFEAAWVAGRRPKIEQYWTDTDGLEILRELLILELNYRLRLGEKPRPNDYDSRFGVQRLTIHSAFASIPTLASLVATSQSSSERDSADRNLLFGVLALQMNFISREQLVACVSIWVLDKSKSLDAILVEQGWLDQEEREALEPLIRKHLQRHGGDAEQSILAARSHHLTDVGLENVSDAEVHATLTRLLVKKITTNEHVGHFDKQEQDSGTVANRFRILKSVARGGIGEVFIALDEELGREVAVKTILEHHASNPDSLQRFQLEAEITSQLEHPGIIPVYGRGIDSNGRPFYAMRFIRGESLKAAINRFHNPTQANQKPGERTMFLRDLLRRFIDVCNALAYAHGRGYLHRDLKPANIMLGEYGETLVVDWGLAKIAGQGASEGLSGQTETSPLSFHRSGDYDATQQGECLGTPAYMSPEQAEGRIDQLGPISDVYSLGATLYQLLVGRAPFDGPDVFVTLRQVRTGTFSRPSVERPEVPRALEAICLKAMSLQASDRYPTAKALALDIENWLADEKVSAFDEPVAPRLFRWARHHRPLVAGIVAITFTALIALSVSSLLIGREVARKQEQKLLAEQNFVLARNAVDRMLTEVAEVELADVPQMQSVRKKLLDRAREFYLGFLEQRAKDPSILREAGRAHLRIGEIDDLLGDHAESERAYREGLDLLSTLATDSQVSREVGPDLIRGRDGLGMLLKKSNRFKESEALLRSAFELSEQLANENPQDSTHRQTLAESRYHLAALLAKLPGRRKEDEAEYRKSIRMQEALVAESRSRPETRRKLARYLNNLALLLASTGQVREAEDLYRESSAILEAFVASDVRSPGDRWQLARTYTNLSMLFRGTRRPDEADSICLKAQALQKSLRADFPDVPDYRYDLSATLNNLGLIRKESHRDKEAEQAFREALGLQEILIVDFPRRSDYRQSRSVTLLNLASLLEPTDVEEAERFYRDSISIQERLVAEYSSVSEYERVLGRTLFSLARLKLSEGDATVSDLLRRAIDYHRRALLSNAQSQLDLEFLRDDYSVLSLASLQVKAYEDAAQAAEQLPKILPREASEALRAAALLAECCSSAGSDGTLNDKRRQELAEGFAKRAVDVLRLAIDRRVLLEVEGLKIKELAPIMTRDDFKAVQQQLIDQLKTRRG